MAVKQYLDQAGLKAFWKAVKGKIDAAADAGVTSFGGKIGEITIQTIVSDPKLGTVKFSMNNNQLTGTAEGIVGDKILIGGTDFPEHTMTGGNSIGRTTKIADGLWILNNKIGALGNAVHFVGKLITPSTISDGETTEVTVVSGVESYTQAAGDVIYDDSKNEYIFDGTHWRLFGNTTGVAGQIDTLTKKVTGNTNDITNIKNGTTSVGKAAEAATIGGANNNKGSETKPVYIKGGIPFECTHTLEKNVPSNAVFTDTYYRYQFPVENLGYTPADDIKNRCISVTLQESKNEAAVGTSKTTYLAEPITDAWIIGLVDAKNIDSYTGPTV